MQSPTNSAVALHHIGYRDIKHHWIFDENAKANARQDLRIAEIEHTTNDVLDRLARIETKLDFVIREGGLASCDQEDQVETPFMDELYDRTYSCDFSITNEILSIN